MIDFTKPQHERLRKRARVLGISFAELVRRILDERAELEKPKEKQCLKHP